MAVIPGTAKQLPEVEWRDADDGRYYTTKWELLSDDVDDLPASIAYDPELPAAFSVFPGDFRSYAKTRGASFTPEDVGTDFVKWTVTIEYVPVPFEFDVATTEAQLPPESRAPKVNWKTILISRVKEKATLIVPDPANSTVQEYANFLVCNSMGDRFDPPHEEEVPHVALVYTRNELNFNPLFANNYINTLNSTVFLGFQADQVWCHSVESGDLVEQRYTPTGGTSEIRVVYRPVTYEFWFANGAETWIEEFPNLGSRYLDADENEQEDPTGRLWRLSTTTSQILERTADTQYRKFRTKNKRDFTALQIRA